MTIPAHVFLASRLVSIFLSYGVVRPQISKGVLRADSLLEYGRPCYKSMKQVKE